MGDDLDVFATQRAILQSALSTPEKITALALLSHWSRRGKGVFPSHGTLAKETSLGVSTVNRTLGELESKGLIRRVREPGKPTKYDLRGLTQLPSERDYPQGEGTLGARANYPRSESGLPSERGTKRSSNRSSKGSREATPTPSWKPSSRPRRRPAKPLPEDWAPTQRHKQRAK